MVILSSPSGAGKTTLVKLLSESRDFYTSISHTTRKLRNNEEEGKDYYFVNNDQFQNLIKKKEFLELKKNSKHDLYKEEADIDLAVRSINDIVISNDDKKRQPKRKKGPLNIAYEDGYNIVFLREFLESDNKNLHDYVKNSLEERGLKSW